MSEEQIDARVAAAVAAAFKTAPRRQASPVAIAGLAVALLVPLAGWTMSLSNRLAVIESQSTSLSSAAVEISALKQEVADFRNEYERDKSNDRRNSNEPQASR